MGRAKSSGIGPRYRKMKNKISQIVYCKENDDEWITVFRVGAAYNKYSISTSSKTRLDRIQKQSNKVRFRLNDEYVDLVISMTFNE